MKKCPRCCKKRKPMSGVNIVFNLWTNAVIAKIEMENVGWCKQCTDELKKFIWCWLKTGEF